jgi:hypothetical protein
MSLIDRSIGSELSEVEKALIFDKKYTNTGFVQYHTKNGEYFYLHPSPFLKTLKKEIYYYSKFPPPPNHSFVETNVVNEQTIYQGATGDNWMKFKEIDKWNIFDPSPLAAKRKTMDFMEIIDFFTYHYKGETESINEIAGCSSLFAFSSPPGEGFVGGINSAILGRDYQWDLFSKSLRIVPSELRKSTSDYYYYISKIEKEINKETGEKNVAIYRPKNLLSDIPIVILDETQRKISIEFQKQLEIESKIITTNLLDALLIKPHATKKVEGMIRDEIYRMQEECYSVGVMSYNQNMGAVPKLAASYCRLHSSTDINPEDVRFVTDLWFEMWRRAEKIETSPMKTNHMLELTGDARKIFVKLYDIFGAEIEISIAEAVREMKMEDVDLVVAVDSLENKGYCIRKDKSFLLLEPFKRPNHE